MSLWRKKPVRVLVIVAGVLLLAMAAVKVFLPAEKVRDLALAQARQRLGREVTVEGVSVSLMGGLGVKLTDLTVQNPAGFAGDPLLSTRSLDLKLALKPLLKKQIQVTRLVLDEPALNLTVNADGANNFTFATPGGTATGGQAPVKSAPAPVINVPELSLSNGRVVYSDARAQGQGVSQVRLNNLALVLGLASTPDGGLSVRGKLQAPDIAVTGSQPVPALAAEAEFDVTWQPDPAAVTLTAVSARVNGIPLTCTGQLALGGAAPTGVIDLKLPETPLVDLAAFAPPELAGKIKGGRDSGLLAADIALTLTGQSEDPVHTRGTAQVRNADLAVAQPFLPPEKGAQVGGRADADLTFALESPDPEQLTYGGTATVRGMSYSQPDLMDQLQNLDGVLAVAPDRFTVQSCTARFASGTFDLTGSLRDPFPYFLPPELQAGKTMKTPHLDFVLHSARLDVDKLLPAASPAAKGKGVKGQPAERAALPPLTFEFPDLTSDGTFAADSLIYMQMPFTAISGKIKARNRVLTCYDIKGGLYNGTVGAAVDIDLKDLNNPGYSGSYRAAGIEVNRFLTRFVDMTGVVFGAGNLQGTFAARGRDPLAIQKSLTVDSDAGLSQGRVVTAGNTFTALNQLAGQLGQSFDKEQSLRDLAAHIAVKDGKVGLQNLTTRLGNLGDVTFGGTMAFTGELDYAGQILLTEEQTTRLFTGGVLGELGKLLGAQRPQRLALPLSVGGLRTDPKVKLDLAAVTGDLQERAAKEQGKKLEDSAKGKLNDLLKKWK